MVRTSLRASDRDALRADVVARLRAGQLVVLPTETVYGLAMLPSHAAAVARGRALLRRDVATPFSLHLPSRADVRPLVHQVPPPIERLLERFWPGPLTVVLPRRDGGDVGLRLPAHEFTRSVIAAIGEPLHLASLQLDGDAALADPDTIAARCADTIDLLVDDGRSPLGGPSTTVHWRGRSMKVPREGILTADEVLHAAAELVLFVCTGNTCRSPLAAALAREQTAAALSVPEAELLAHGLQFASAGTSAIDGDVASEGSLAAGAEAGLDLAAHRSQPLTPELVRRASRIYCMAQSHRRAVLAEAPAAGTKITLLRPDQLDVADPYGGDLRGYRRARDEIRAAVRARLTDWMPRD